MIFVLIFAIAIMIAMLFVKGHEYIPKPELILRLIDVKGHRITIGWNIPFENGMILEWKQDNKNDEIWPKDFFHGGNSSYNVGLKQTIFDAIPNINYAFRLKRGEEISNILKVNSGN